MGWSFTSLACPAQFVLTPGGPVPGECLPLNGSKGEVIIHLREPIVPTALTYEHVPSAITYDFRSAPSDITVVGSLALVALHTLLQGHSSQALLVSLKYWYLVYCTLYIG